MRHLMPVLFAAAASFLSTGPAHADLGDQLFKLQPDDGAAEDWFGISGDVSGDTAIVGAWHDDDDSTDSGSAYLFNTTTGRQISKLLPDDGTSHDEFGVSVAISGAIAIVGARAHGDNGSWSGSAYLFDTTTGQQISKLLPDDGAVSDFFGHSAAINGTTAIVGAFGNDDSGLTSGSAYVFDISDPAKPVQTVKLLPKDGAAWDYFGYSVAISGDTAIVGAYWDDDNGSASGSAYLFDITNGEQIAKLLPDDGAAGEWFGWSVAISGTTGIVGAIFDDDNGYRSGSAYLFDTTTGLQIAKLLPDDGDADDRFGVSVAISGAPGNETVIVGALWDDDNGDDSGSAYLFDAGGSPGKCPWDLDGSGDVGVKDLLILLGVWGPCKDCPADFDGSGDVGAKDLLILLGNWGPCP